MKHLLLLYYELRERRKTVSIRSTHTHARRTAQTSIDVKSGKGEKKTHLFQIELNNVNLCRFSLISYADIT